MEKAPPSLRQHIITVVLLLCCLILTTVALVPRITRRQVAIQLEQPNIRVAISGAVQREGVYELPWGSTVDDVLEQAGGFRSGAERSLVNLAELLDEGSNVYIPYRQSRQSISGITERISLNSASALELEQLPGVGPSTAQKIIEGRPYSRVEDLLRVSGIGEITLERLRPLVRM